MRVALVTGGAKRIGAEICRSLMADGWYVLIHCRGSLEEAENLLANGSGDVLKADLTLGEDVERLIIEVNQHKMVEKAGGLDLLIHNASIYSQIDFESVERSDLQKLTALHLDAPFFLSQGLSPLLKAKKGNIIGMVDTSWNHAWEELSHYTATKGALRQLLVNLAGELAPEIRVNGIAPGAILAADWEKERFDKIVQRIPLGRAGTPQDIAKAVHFLIESDYITGFILPVDGGWSLT